MGLGPSNAVGRALREAPPSAPAEDREEAAEDSVLYGRRWRAGLPFPWLRAVGRGVRCDRIDGCGARGE
jgi:hypothetical protein